MFIGVHFFKKFTKLLSCNSRNLLLYDPIIDINFIVFELICHLNNYKRVISLYLLFVKYLLGSYFYLQKVLYHSRKKLI